MAEPETDLTRLLTGMQPRLQPGAYVFCTLTPGRPLPTGIAPIGQFLEAEGLSLILKQQEALATGFAGQTTFRMITLEIHSSLDAVGFLAAVTAKLAAHGIAVNAVSAFHHDHLFVPAERAEEALGLLRELERTAE